jgi:uncharacterized protein YoxC
MANANINIQLSNGKQAGQTINELRQQANRLTREVNNLKPGTEEFVKKSADLNKVKGRLGEVRKEVQGVSDATGGMVSEMLQFVPFGDQIQGIAGRVRLLSGGFKGLRAAIISTGIGALVVVMGSLFAWFQRTEEGAQKLRVITAALGQVFNSLMDVVSAGGSALYDMFSNPKEAVTGLWEVIKTNILNRVTGLIDTFKFAGKAIKAALDLDWDAMKENAAAAGESIMQATTGIPDLPNKAKKAVDGAKESIKDLYKEIKTDVAGAVALQERENKLIEDKRNFMLREEALQNKISDARKKGNDQTLSNAERAEALNLAMDLQNTLANEKIALAEEEYLIQKERNALSNTSEADLDKEIELERELGRIRRKSTDEQREIFSMVTGIQKQEQDKRVRQTEEATKIELEATKKLEDLKVEAMEDGLQKQIAKIEMDTERKMAALTGSEEQIREQRLLLEDIANQQIADAKEKHNQEANLIARKSKKLNSWRLKKSIRTILKI